jgi:RNA polymerase primary sigma factor
MSQAELAAEIGVTRAAVSAWITNRAEPQMNKIQAIEDVLGLSSGSLVSRQDPGTSVEALTWYHRPAHDDGGREFGNAAAFAFDPNLGVLAREATQNSLDERLNKDEPVRVRHILDEIEGERLYDFLEALRWNELEPHLDAAAGSDNKVGRILAEGIRDLRQTGRLLLLRIDDYNAAGLTGSDYDNGRFAAVTRRQLESRKQGEAAGGSYGLGKATFWATSRLGLVLINSTLSEPYQGRTANRMFGRLELPWRRAVGNEWAGPAWFGEPDPERRGATRSWWGDDETAERLFLKRDSGAPGTSFLIIGAHDPSGEADSLESMHAALVDGLAASFWASMVATPQRRPMLEASVVARRNGVVVVPEERIDPDVYEPTRSRALRAFLQGRTVSKSTAGDDVVQRSVRLQVPPLKSTGKATAMTHDAVLLLAREDTPTNRSNRLVCMRSSRMVVMNRGVTDLPMGVEPFQAVLLAGEAAGADVLGAKEAEQFLRAAEPPEHNDWKRTDDLTTTYARGAVTGIRNFRSAMLEEVRRALRPSEDRAGDGPTSLKGLLDLGVPRAQSSGGARVPVIDAVEGTIDVDGAWRVRVEIRLPVKDDAWMLTPILRFASRSGPKPEARWAKIEPESHCELTEDGALLFTAGCRTASFSGVSDVSSHPVAARMAFAEIDLRHAKEPAE